MADFDEFYSARDVIRDFLYKDLVGPVKPDEILSEYPIQYYVMGKLYPKDQNTGTNDTSRNASIESETDPYDASLASANMTNPSSMGLTCTLRPDVKEIRIECSFATYTPLLRDEAFAENPEFVKKIEKREQNNKKEIIFWRREKHRAVYFEKLHDFTEFPEETLQGVSLKGFVHHVSSSGESIFTAVLINETSCTSDYTEKNMSTLFQPHIRITATDQKSCIFTTVMRQVEIKENPELIEMDMLYDRYRYYAQGHGCSVMWGNKEKEETKEPDFVETSYMPLYNLKQMRAAGEFNPVFNMNYIVSEKPHNVIQKLRLFTGSYSKWIDELEDRKSSLSTNYARSATENIDKCRKTLKRIKHSVDLLEKSASENGASWRAFVYANEAMMMQRIQSLKKQNGSSAVDLNKINWYPFQLAFILQEIPSITEPESEDRKLVDLLWFPTGGGKTEAYLGIAAFVIFYRRLVDGEKGEGVAVFMRYTLRLLTMQQFERASMLICACELLRRKYHLSEFPIEIGLWVGNETTPKDTEKAENALDKLSYGAPLDNTEADPRQFRVCPWCGAELTTADYSVDRKSRKMIIRCKNPECEFHQIGELPVRVTDQEIYERTPAFIVGTVDKFAQILFEESTFRIFGVDTGHNPPDLIIQDEMHLISGPLGTMTGIYEGAITRMCQKGNIPVKIIASTATIRNASGQINSLYGRKFTQFPPQGLDADDAYFAEKSNEEQRPARLYVGVMGVGTTMVTTLIRVYAAWLFASRYLVDLQYKGKPYSDTVIDEFWTMTGYFNSLRELGAARTQIVDDVQSRYKYLKELKFADVIPAFSGEESYAYSDELTSRKDNEKLTQILQVDLKKPFSRNGHADVYDFIVATNMISVGVDIDRLGVMTVAGQPKTNAEYIQATSRVGRHYPGLVITVFNAAKSRDRSHYEQFIRYHSAMYRYVEATSLTPFSDRARDRGLQALFVILCRYYIPKLRANDAAGNFDKNDTEIKKITQMIVHYAEVIDDTSAEDVRNELMDIINEWEEISGRPLKYRHGKDEGLLKPDTEVESRFRAMNSMRSVEEQSGIYLLQ